MLNEPRIHIQVQSTYVENQSQPEQQRFVFAYTISIRNLGHSPVQLISRYWLITNSNGHQTEVQGEGVVGEQPLILPGTEYRYSSGAILETPLGTMEGHYEMVDHDGHPFRVAIPVFRLAIPTLIN
ncbi:Co2+/Mg2+ efflux protein ApaG [Xenorhabdus szentirmaii]|uniref:Protein ApaG n=2 Tax=Xenorhabdus szentirmaii TaxID=290112 RepID=W1IUV3_9GAMM|nr:MULTISPECIES: Co2+/Mg2+ efflux protein ApaG [Xenorhabdus]MBD2781019.1 Co2+/Mg2+ efflux protein ApaG [Xenorhabdus sp. 38]MBD2793192.1 Co2+/Mg2+ efflux protein ApaG [Xenorhabdus sp. CUL]MBD2801716.1 Co2+/Mg2+ efflux protein ApaG [Xenorhabdus sp. M]MBD2805998.1 Co2+/Mg2+ efflux protein ApaG [Xenorhabdus sp. ZM]MBD2819844.1 Co2+/Mg2+ efflux protein ApaG [Xenorhabdus sp. 42]